LVSKFYGEIRAFFDLTLGLGILAVGMTHYLERFQRPTQVARQEFLAEGRIVASLRKFTLGNQSSMALAFEKFEKS